MSVLALAPAPIERVAADLAVVALFADERPLQGAAGRVDWRLCGRLSHLCADGRLRGEPGAAVLIPGGGGVRAPRVLGLGAGARDDLDGDRWTRWVEDALARARGLCAERIVLALPESDDATVERLALLAKALAADPGEIEVLLAPEPSDRAGVAEWLRGGVRRARAAGLEVVPPGELRSPQGAAAPSPHPESSRATAGRFTR